MKTRPNERLIELVDVASGTIEIGKLGAMSDKDRNRLNGFFSILKLFQVRTEDAPEHVVVRAKAIQPNDGLQQIRAVLGRISLAGSGARFESADQFQATYMAGSLEVRLGYERTPFGWNVMGRAPSCFYELDAGGLRVELDADGRFEVKLNEIADVEWHLYSAAEDVTLPSLREAVAGGPS